MKTRFLFLAILLGLCATNYGQISYKQKQVILQFTADATQAERLNLIGQLGTLWQDEDGDLSYIDDLALVRVSQFPVAVNGVFYQDEVELTGGIHDNHARLDGAGLNYRIQQSPTEFNLPLGDWSGNSYSPLSPACEANYPGGLLYADDFSSYQSAAITVAILDSGVDPYYDFINQYLAGAVDVTQDDDGTGSISFRLPYDYNNPVGLDIIGHGTAVAGIIAGLADRANVPAESLNIIPIKCFGDGEEGDLFNMLQALRVAEDLGVEIMNLSWSYFSDNPDNLGIFRERIEELSNENGTLLITSAGNDGVNIEDNPVAPASFTNAENLLTVSGTDLACNGFPAEFSNYGNLVDLAAPGEGLIVPGVDGYWSAGAAGTSFATPIVTAAAVQSWLCLLQGGGFEVGTPATFASTAYFVRGTLLNSLVPSAELQSVGVPGVVSFAGVCNYSGGKPKSLSTAPIGSRPTKEQEDFKVARSHLSIFPNPFSRELRLSVAPNEAIEGLDLYGINGELIFSKSFEDSSSLVLVEIASLPPGVYSLRVHTDKTTVVHKVVRQ